MWRTDYEKRFPLKAEAETSVCGVVGPRSQPSLVSLFGIDDYNSGV